MLLKFEYVYQLPGNLVKTLILGRSEVGPEIFFFFFLRFYFLTSSLMILHCWSVDHISIKKVLGYELIAKILTTRANLRYQGILHFHRGALKFITAFKSEA